MNEKTTLPKKPQKPRKRLPVWAHVVLCVAIAGVGFQGCRTIRGLLQGNLTLDDIAKDMAGLAALSKAAREANRAISPEDEVWLGRAVACHVLSRYQYQYMFYGQVALGEVPPGLTTYLYNIGAVLAAAAEARPAKGDRPPPILGYRFVVLNSPQINAFAAPGGFIFVTTGMLRLARTEDELAAILAHEMAHVVRGHGVRAIRKARKMRVWKILASEAAAGAFGDNSAAADFLNAAVADIIDTMVIKGYSRKSEYEADWRATQILYWAGYNPFALKTMVTVMHNLRVGASGGFYSTHPKPADRLRYLAKVLPKRSNYAPPPAQRMARFRTNVAMVSGQPQPGQPGPGQPGQPGPGQPGPASGPQPSY